MHKEMIKIILKCILAVFLISIPFILINYLITINYTTDDVIFSYLIVILKILQIISAIAAGLIFRRKYKAIMTENSVIVKRYMIGSVIVAIFAAINYFYNDFYWNLYFTITSYAPYVSHDDSLSLFIGVCLEQITDGKLLFLMLLCVFICFTGAVNFRKIKKA